MTLTFDLYLTLTLSLTFDLDGLKKYTFFHFFFIFFEVTWRKNVTSYVKTDGRIQKCHSIKNFLQPTRNLYHFRFKSYGPLCDFHWFFWSHVTYKDDVVRQNRGCLVEAEFYKEPFSNQPEVSTTSGSKVMGHYVISTKVVTLTLIFIRFSPKKIARVLRTEYISCQNFRKIEPVVWPVHRAITDRQTDRQTNRQTDRQTDKPRWPIYFAKIYDFAK